MSHNVASGSLPQPDAVPRPSDWLFLQPAVMDGMHDAVIATDIDGRITGTNRAAQTLYGYSNDELLGQSVSLLYPTDEDQQLATVFASVRQTGEFRGEVRNVTRSGKSVYVHTALTLLRDPDGKPAGMVCFSIDVTAHKLGAIALKRTSDVEEQLRSAQGASAIMKPLFAAVECAEDVFLMTEAEPIDQPGPRILYVNPAFEKLTGYTREEVIGQTPRILQGPRTDRTVLDRIRAALKAWKPVREEMVNYRKDGTEFVVELAIVPIANEHGWYTHWMAIQRDVTEQRRMQQQVAEGQSRFHFLTEAIPHLLWTAGATGNCEFVSQACSRFLGVSAHLCLGDAWQQFIHPADKARVAKFWMDSIRSRQIFSIEYRLRRHDGVYVWYLHRAVPRFDDQGSVLEWIGSSTDIEQGKRSEEAIRQTEKLAAVGRLASSIAHEINNPLASVTNLLYLLSMQPSLSPTSAEYVKSAQDELARVSEITTQTLRFHNQSTAAAPARLAEILDGVLSFYRPRMVASALHVRREYERTEQVLCFAGEIRQALVNLLGNAIEASEQGGYLRIRLRGSVNWKNRRQRGVRISLADNGHGILPDTFAHIFEPFFTTKGDTGTGLGLWITKDLIEKHEGTISLYSSTTPDRSGTVVSVFLPFEPKRKMTQKA